MPDLKQIIKHINIKTIVLKNIAWVEETFILWMLKTRMH